MQKYIYNPIKKMEKKKVLVICSGGLDSVSMALQNHQNDVTLLTFNYGQKAQSEIAVVQHVAMKYGMKQKTIDLSHLKAIFGQTQLTSDIKIEDGYQKSVVVPLRNALFLQVAMIYAYTHNIEEVLLGSHLDDCIEVDGERAFPDCSPEFFKAFQLAMDLGTFRKSKKVRINSASTLGMSKTDLIRKAYAIDSEVLFKTWSCYCSGDKQCGHCDSCNNRKRAFKVAEIKDETEYEE